MTTALYRRYRPETFGEMIGQSQVTEPLMTALRGDRVGHAYLFSGPRGCGKTTSARILARCLNCAAGPTDTPCGTCDSCVELSRGGGGSLDVVEIDAASHNGVDDARDLRERAIFAPARDRFKIFILDEAHMVTAQGFNALLKLVEEPPDHVKFIFATTEPEKVIGTIRSRTHHYPFRLVAPGPMLEYVEQLCRTEDVQVEPGVLPLVVRAGGGSPRDTLSLLDQLIAGSEDGAVKYERAVALLGYTHAELLDEVVDAFGAHDAAAAFSAVDRVVQTGQDPRRFVDDLLERLRDLIIVSATGAGAAAVFRGITADELDRMGRQAAAFGTDRLSRIADLVVATLDDMTGATSPRLQLELLVARVLAGAGAAAPTGATPVSAAGAGASVPGSAAPGAGSATGASVPVTGSVTGASVPVVGSVTSATAPVAAGAASDTAVAGGATGETDAAAAGSVSDDPRAGVATAGTDVAAAPPAAASPAAASPPAPVPTGPVTFAQIRDAWPEILNRLEPVSRSSWMIATAARPVAFSDAGVLTLSFQSQADVAAFKKLNAGQGPSEDLRGAIHTVLGVRVKYVAKHDSDPTPPAPPAGGPGGTPGGGPGSGLGASSGEGRPRPGSESRPSSPSPSRGAAAAASSAATPVTEWAVAPIPTSDDAPAASTPFAAPAVSSAGRTSSAPLAVDDEPEEAESAPVRTLTLPREGDIIPLPDEAPDDEDAPPPPDDDAPIPARAPVAVERPAAPRPSTAPRRGGIERVGEAVVRQVLGATFVREEPYTAPTTRFS